MARFLDSGMASLYLLSELSQVVKGRTFRLFSPSFRGKREKKWRLDHFVVRMHMRASNKMPYA